MQHLRKVRTEMRERMENTLVTVVVPIYQTEKYLDRCVASIVNQTYSNLQIILVDDGSPDRCPQLCDEWAKKDSRIQVIHQENRGLGMARNTGLEQAQGTYICFVDSDDYIAETAIELACMTARQEGAELVLFGMSGEDACGNVIKMHLPQVSQRVYTGLEVQEILLPDVLGPDGRTGISKEIPASACTALFAAELIKRAGWRFVSEREIISEDIYSMIALFAHVQKAVVLEKALYVCCENEASLSRSYRPDRYEKNRYFYIQCLKLCKECGYSDEVFYRCSEPFLRNTIAAMKQEAACHDRKRAIRNLRQIVDDRLLQQVLDRKRGDKTNLQKRILFWAIRNRCYLICHTLLRAKNAVKK